MAHHLHFLLFRCLWNTTKITKPFHLTFN